jgi:hypothetical protein
VEAVGDEGGGADATADPDAVRGDELVASEPDGASGRDPPGPVDGLGVDEPVDGLPRGDAGRQGDHGHDEDAGQVLGAAVAVRVTPVGGPAPEPERDAERHRGEGVGEVVDGVGQQGHRAGQRDHDDLEHRGDAEAAEADDQRPHALAVGGGRVDGIGMVVAVRREQVANGGDHPGAAAVVMGVRLGAVRVVVVVAQRLSRHGRGGVAVIVAVVGGGHALRASVESG